ATAQAPRCIKAVCRGGCRFSGRLLPVGPAPGLLAPRPPTPLASPAPLLVGRARELAHLHQCLGRVRQGTRQTVLLTGEPGIGKTTLVNAFVAELADGGEAGLAQGPGLAPYRAGGAPPRRPETPR